MFLELRQFLEFHINPDNHKVITYNIAHCDTFYLFNYKAPWKEGDAERIPIVKQKRLKLKARG